MVLVRFRQSPRAAAAAAAQASRPLPGLELKRLVGKHQDVHVGRDFEHASGHGSLQRALSQSEPLPSDALMLFGITDGSSVPAKVAQLKGHAGRQPSLATALLLLHLPVALAPGPAVLRSTRRLSVLP